MHDISAPAEAIRLIIHNDDDTPLDFIRGLLRTVFGKSEREAIAFEEKIESDDKAVCGPYPGPVAKALLDAAQQSIGSAGHRLRITSEVATAKTACDLCGALATGDEIPLAGKTACLCNSCLLAVRRASEAVPADEFHYACAALDWHFAGIPQKRLVTRSRQFPGHMRADVQVAPASAER